MGKMSDQRYLRNIQYVDASNLNARIAIHANFSTGKEPWNEFVFRHVRICKGMRVLAVGCGNATQWRANQAHFPSDSELHLSDFSFGMLNEAKTHLAESPCFDFALVDAEHIPYTDLQLDLVTANHMLYHVPHIHAALAEIKRVLRPDGCLMAATNGEAHMLELYILLHQFCADYRPETGKHTRFSIENGGALLSQFFRYVQYIPYLSDLWVIDAGALADYVYSMWDAEGVIKLDARKELASFFQAKIDAQGGIFIRKLTGIFIASDVPDQMRT